MKALYTFTYSTWLRQYWQEQYMLLYSLSKLLYINAVTRLQQLTAGASSTTKEPNSVISENIYGYGSPSMKEWLYVNITLWRII